MNCTWIYSPPKTIGKPEPAVILIQGGAKRSGDKSLIIPLAQKLDVAGIPQQLLHNQLSGKWVEASIVNYVDKTHFGKYLLFY